MDGDIEESIKFFEIPDISELSDKDYALFKEFADSGDIFFLMGLILRLIRKTDVLYDSFIAMEKERNSSEKLNDTMVETIKSNMDRIEFLETLLDNRKTVHH